MDSVLSAIRQTSWFDTTSAEVKEDSLELALSKHIIVLINDMEAKWEEYRKSYVKIMSLKWEGGSGRQANELIYDNVVVQNHSRDLRELLDEMDN